MLHRSRSTALALLALAVCAVAPPAQASPAARAAEAPVPTAVAAERHPVASLTLQAFESIQAITLRHADHATMSLLGATLASPARSGAVAPFHRSRRLARLRGSSGLERWNTMRTTMRRTQYERHVRQWRTHSSLAASHDAEPGSRPRH